MLATTIISYWFLRPAPSPGLILSQTITVATLRLAAFAAACASPTVEYPQNTQHHPGARIIRAASPKTQVSSFVSASPTIVRFPSPTVVRP